MPMHIQGKLANFLEDMLVEIHFCVCFYSYIHGQSFFCHKTILGVGHRCFIPIISKASPEIGLI